MPELSDSRQEKFAQLLAADRSKRPKQSRWYREAGFEPDSGNAARLAHHPTIIARVVEIRAQMPAEPEVIARPLDPLEQVNAFGAMLDRLPPELADIQMAWADLRLTILDWGARRGKIDKREAYVEELIAKIARAEALGDSTAVSALMRLKGMAWGVLLQEGEEVRDHGRPLGQLADALVKSGMDRRVAERMLGVVTAKVVPLPAKRA